MGSYRIVNNEKGIAMIGLVIIVTLGVLSYTAFTASSFLVMLAESKRQKREFLGSEAMNKIAQHLAVGRKKFVEHSGSCGSDPVYRHTRGSFCLRDGDSSCVQNPFDPTQNLCARVATGITPFPTIRWSYQENIPGPDFLKPYIKDLHHFNLRFGKKVVEVASAVRDRAVAEAPMARAIVREVNLPPAGSLGVAGFSVTAPPCAAGDVPNARCMTCAEDGVAAPGSVRPVCLRLKVCMKLPTGSCNTANLEEWFWQIVAVTAPPRVL